MRHDEVSTWIINEYRSQGGILYSEQGALDDLSRWQPNAPIPGNKDKHMSTRKYIRGANVKALSGGRFGGYLVKFTGPDDRDLHGEFFTAETDFMDSVHEIVGKPILYNHAFDDAIKAVPVGVIDRVERRDDGIYVEGRNEFQKNYTRYIRSLKRPADWKAEQESYAADYQKMLDEMIEDGMLGWSSGALPQAVEVDDKRGWIKCWPIIEGTLTPTPAEPTDTRITALKSYFDALFREPTAIETDTEHDASSDATKSNNNKHEGIKMDETQLRELITSIVAEILADMQEEKAMYGDEEEAARMAMEEEAERMVEEEVKADGMDEEEVKASVRRFVNREIIRLASAGWDAAAKKREAEKAARRKALREAAQADTEVNDPKRNAGAANTKASRVQVGDNLKYAHLSADDMLVGFQYLNTTLPPSMRGRMLPVSDEYMTHMAQKAVAEMKRNGFKSIQDEVAVKSVMPFKADEIDATNISGQGQDWVGVLYGTRLWEKARDEVDLLREMSNRGMVMQEVPQGSGSVVIPTEGADPIAYSTPQANDLDATNRVEVTANVGFFGTGSVTMTPGQIKIAAAATDELTEDSVIPILPNMTRQMTVKAQETIEQALLNGDTATGGSTNINLIDGTPGTGIDRPYYLAVNGLRKYPLVTNTDYARSASGSLAIDDYRLTLSLFGGAVRSRLGNLLFVIDVDTHDTSLALPEIATDDVRRTYATITSGRVLNVYGVDILTTSFLGLANTAGKQSGTPGNNTTGQVLALYAPYWAFGWKRDVEFKTQEDILSGVTYAVASMRFGFVARGADASAITYNVGIS